MRNSYLLVLITVSLLFSILSLNAQGIINNNWQLGSQNINFSNSVPTASTIAGSVSLNYGIATVSDSSGNLLFYTDGKTVWNKMHDVMTNGAQLSQQEIINVIIVPNPGNINQYFIFRSENNSCLCFYMMSSYYLYSIVEFNSANPMGIVLTINPNPGGAGSYENIYSRTLYEGNSEIENTLYFGPLIATVNESGNAYWIVAQNKNKILSYKLDNLGFNPTPVISTFNNNEIYNYGHYNSSFGRIDGIEGAQLRISEDNSKLVGLQYTRASIVGFNTNYSDPDASTDPVSFKNTFYQIDFNSQTGVFSNYKLISKEPTITGFEISSDSKKLYFVRLPKPASWITISKGEVVVKDLDNLPSPPRILNLGSSTTSSSNFTHLQKDRSGTILISSTVDISDRNKFLHKIMNQNSYDTSSVLENHVFLNNYHISLMPQLIPELVQACPEVQTISNNLISGISNQQASISIFTSSNIGGGANARYHAGSSVIMTNGFHAKNGSYFRGYIEGCSGVFAGRVTDSIRSIENLDTPKKLSLFKIFPNPSDEYIIITTEKSAMSSVRINNFYGREISYQKISNAKEFMLNVQAYVKGLYIVTIETNDGKSHSQKFQKK